MARAFEVYGPVVPLGATWEEEIQLTDANEDPIDLTGYDVRSQLRVAVPVVAEGAATTAPILELTTADFYDTDPDWPVVAGWSIPSPTNGTMLLAVAPGDFTDVVSPVNAKVKLFWDVRLVNKVTGYTIPVVTGKAVFLPRTTV